MGGFPGESMVLKPFEAAAPLPITGRISMNKNSKNVLIAGLCATTTAVIVGCGGSGSSAGPSSGPGSTPSPPAPTYLLGGTVSGLRDGASLTFTNGNDSVAVNANGSFTFPSKLAAGANYEVSVSNSPGYDCRLGNEAASVANADVTAVSVQCLPHALAGKEVPLYQPAGLAVDAEGNAYVADTYFHMIQKITPAGAISIFAGAKNGGPGDVDGPAAEARFRFNNLTSMLIDREGNLIVGDSCNSSIRKVTRAGVVSTVAGPSSAKCDNSAITKDGLGSAAGFRSVGSMALDVNGDYIVEGGLNAIRRVTPAGMVSTNAWTESTPLGSTDHLDYIRKLTVGKNGIIYAIGSGMRLWQVAGGVATPFAGGAVRTTLQALNGVGAAAAFNVPQALTSDNAGNLYVADYGALRKVAPDATVTTLAGIYVQPYAGGLPPPPDVIDGTGAAARFGAPSSLAVDIAGNIVALDPSWNVLRYITPQGVVTTNPGTPLLVQYRDGAGSSARFTNDSLRATPTVDAKGNIFIRDTYTVRMITPDGTVSRYAGNMNLPGAIDGGKDSATLGLQFVMSADKAGNLYLVSRDSQMIRKIVSGVTSTLFQRPELATARAIAVSATGQIAVATESGVKVYLQDGTVLDTVNQARVVALLGKGNPSSYNPFGGLVYDSSGNLFISDATNAVIHKLSKDGKLSIFVGMPGLAGDKDGGPGTGTIFVGDDLTIDPSGNLYILSPDQLKLRKITPSGVISTLPLPWGARHVMSGVAYGNGRLYAMSRNALMQMWAP